jgi:serine/threonine protein phosphatase PrpC
MKLRQGARSDVGKTRDHNEDNFGIGEGEPVEQMGELLVLCDGMGGHAAGEVASQIGVETILAVYYGEAGENRPQALEQAFEQANAQIYARGQGSMGTTGVAALLHHDALHIANVGDSRAYLIRDGEIRQISRDHSFVSDQVAAGLITPDQARLSPHRNVITRALGYQPEVSVDLFRLPLQIGDIVVLSSDGMHGLVLDQEILETVTTLPPDQAVDRLIDLANSRGGTDNITVVMAQVEALDWYSAESIAAADDESLDDRTTHKLPVTAEQPAITAPVQPDALAPTHPPAPAPRAPAPIERRLSMLGGLLAIALLAVLIGLIVFAMNATPVLAPGTAATPARVPTQQATTAAATSAATAAATAVPTGGPAVNSTAQPASTPTAAAP